MKKLLLFLVALFLWTGSSWAQTTLISPTGDGGFETGATPALNNWTAINSTTDGWYVGLVPVVSDGTNCGYISSTAGAAWTYSQLSVIQHIYYDVTIPAGESKLTLTFKWKANGEGTGSSDYDNMKIFFGLSSSISTPVANTAISATYQIYGSGATNGMYKLNSSAWNTETISITGTPGSTYRLVFSWKSDSSTIGNPPAAIDEVSLTSTVPNPLNGSYSINNTLPTTTPMVHDGSGNFNSFTAAFNYLNSDGISAATTFNVTAGQTFNELIPILTATGTISNTITFQKNGIGANPIISAGTGTGSTDGIIRIAGGDYITFDGFDLVENASNVTSTTQMEYGYFLFNANGANGAQNNTIKNSSITLIRTNTTSRGIYQFTSTTPTATTGSNSNNTYDYITVANSYHGIYLTGNATYPDLSCVIKNSIIGSASANDIGNGTGAVNGIRVTSSSGISVFNNEVRNLTSTGTGSVYGIYIESLQGTTGAVYNNEIHDLKTTSTSTSSIIYGLRTDINSSMICNVYNNMVYALQHGIITASATQVIRGIAVGVSGAGTGNFYFNSVRIDEDAAPSSTAFYIGANGTINSKDNIFSNFSTAGATSLRYCIFKVSGSTLNTSDFNDYYINTAGTNNHTGSYNATNYNTLANWQTITSKDAASLSIDPQFTSTSNLHIPAGTTTQLESGGTPIAGITTDNDGDTRNLTTPDIGADEFAGLPLDLSGPSINYTTLINTSSTANRTLSGVTITDLTGVDWTNLPRLYFKKSTDDNAFVGNTSGDNGWKYVVANISSSPTTFTIDYTIINGGSVSAGEIVQYFVVAQDIVGTANVSANPSGGFSGTSVSSIITAPTTPNSYIISFAFTGTYNVGSSQTYTTLTSAGGFFSAVNNGVVTGNIIVNITSDITEDGTNALNQWTEEGAGNYTLTILPDAATLRTISGTLANGLIRLNGADRVTFDGRFSGSGQYLKFINTNTLGAVIHLISLGTGAGASNNTIRNCNIIGGSVSATNYGVYAGSAVLSTTGTGDDNDNLIIRDNIFNRAFYAIYCRSSATGLTNGLQIINNEIGSATATEYIGKFGIDVTQATGATISGNTIFNFIGTNTNPTGILIGTGFVSSNISENKIYSLKYTGSTGYGGKGIDINTGSATSALNVYNNIIYDITGDGYTTGSSDAIYGIRIQSSQGGINLYYNSVNMYGDISRSAATVDQSYALYIGTGVTNLNIKDNVFANAIVNITGASTAYAIFSASANTAFAAINYNDYFASGVEGVLGYLSTNKTILLDWQTATAQDANSIAVDPQFTTSTNLQPFAGSPVLATGTPIGGITTDYTGASRSGSIPSMGAYESGVVPASIDWANMQWPPTGTITEGGTLTVYARAWEPGVTEAVGAGEGIECWIGWGAVGTNPNTWSNWNVASFNVQVDNNDEFMGTIGSGISAGTYNYAVRWRITGGSYQYGGYNAGGGGFWDGTTNVSGLLTVNPYSVTLPYSQGFEDVTFPPTGWAYESVVGSEVWVRSTTAFNSGVASAKITFQLTGGEDWLITPKIMGIVTDDQLSFWWANAFGTAYPPDNLDILVSTTDKALASFTTTLGTIVTSSAPADWTQHIYSLSAFAGQNIYIAFKHTNTDGNGGYLDDIELSNSISTWLGTIDSDWTDADNWSTGVPTSAVSAIIGASANDPILSTNATVLDLTIDPTATLTIANTGQLTISTTITNNAGNSGLVLQSDAGGTGSLLHNTLDVNATIQRYLTGSSNLSAMMYHFVSVPLTSAANPTQNLFLGCYLFEFTEADNDWLGLGSSTTTPLNYTKGYMTYYPAGSSTTKTFAGPMNNGSFSPTVSYTNNGPTANEDGWNLVPNPYPSAIGWLTGTWTKTAIDNSIYIWPAGAAAGTGNYASFVGGVGANGGTEFVPVGQSFFVHATASPVLTMDNTARVHSSQAFWKNSEVIPNLLRINALANGAKDEAVIRFIENATENFDSDWDAYKLKGGEDAPQLSSVSADNNNLSINGLPYSSTKFIVPLNFKFNAESEVSFISSCLESFSSEISIYLEDKLLNKNIDLRTNPVYTFNHSSIDDVDRFSLVFYGVNSTPEINTKDYNIWSTVDHLNIHIPALTGQKAIVELYDLLGHLVLSQQVNLGSPTQIAVPQFNGMGIVRVIANSQVFSEKVFIR